MNEANRSQGTLETKEDAGVGEAGEVARWLLELDLYEKSEKDWKKKANKCLERYRDEKDRDDSKFNILWSNVEVMRPQLYGSTPKADVKQRFKDQDPIGNAAAEIMERGLDYSIDIYDFDGVMANVILDYLLPGRGLARIRFKPVIEPVIGPEGPTERLIYARTYCERVPWDSFKRGPGKTWDEVPWIGYEHFLTKTEIEAQFPGMSELVGYDVVMEGVEKEKADNEPSVFKRVKVIEIWDKEAREVLFLAPSLKERFLKREPDPLSLEGFFDCPRPLYAVESGNCLIPQCEYEMYRDQAKELDRVTLRINRLVNALKVRGIYDSTVSEFKELFWASDNEMVPTSSSQAAMAAGGLDKAVWMMPIERITQVLRELYIAREQIKQTIYEITGVSDILRGATNPNETLGAQQLKAQTGSMRLQRRQRDVQRFIKELLRKKAEIIAENYTPELLAMMTGIKLPRMQEKMSAQAMAEQGQQVPPEILNAPSWEEVMQVLQSDLLRAFRIDIETDSTVAADQAAERQQVTDLIAGIGGFVQQMAPAVQSGLMTQNAAKKILFAALRRFKLGRAVEDQLENDVAQPMPEQDSMKAEVEARQAEMQARQQMEMQKLELDLRKHQDQMSLEKYKFDTQAVNDMQKHQMKLTADAEGKKMMAEASAKPTTTVQFNAEEAVHGVAQTIASMAESQVAQSQMLQEILAVNAQTNQAVAQSLQAGLQSQQQQAQALLAVAQEAVNASSGNTRAVEELTKIMRLPRKAVRDKAGNIQGSVVEE